MARLRRAALILLVGGAVATTAPPAGLHLTGGGQPGSLVVANQGPAPVTIARALAVEARDGGRWTAVDTEFNAVASCPLGPGTRAPAPAPLPAVVIPPGRSLRVMPWLGYSCSGQCGGSCMANRYLGPGTFRFVATVLPGGARVAGPAFVMVPERPGDLMRKLLGTVRPQRGQ